MGLVNPLTCVNTDPKDGGKIVLTCFPIFAKSYEVDNNWFQKCCKRAKVQVMMKKDNDEEGQVRLTDECVASHPWHHV